MRAMGGVAAAIGLLMPFATFGQRPTGESPPGWNCSLHVRGVAEVESLILHRYDNGYYGDQSKMRFWMMVEDTEMALILVYPVTGVYDPGLQEVIGVQTLIIDKRRRLARLSGDYLQGGPDKASYGVCLPDSAEPVTEPPVR